MVDFQVDKREAVGLINRPQTYVFDLDGVIYRGNEPQPHASETVAHLRHRGNKVFFYTNNATRSRKDYQDKLQGMDIQCQPEEIMTSAYATALFLRESGKTRIQAYVVGEAGLIQELESADVEVLRNGSVGKVDYVIAGLDRQFNYDKLTNAQQAILAGAKFIATNRDATFPIEEGVVIPGGGAIVSAIETASGQTPFVIGKPETYALEKIIKIAGGSSELTVVVGDRLETDILVGNRVGAHTVMVTTGISTREDAETAPLELKPEIIIDDLIELLDISWSEQ